ncbi:hypothetical protein [Halobacillus aidingensis]|uniref:Uncharacterized protein n=1 Tax=Halobacillus aidingensis TaxID=240303 RepID=A0A1H0MJV1_HALAD|nr:hypothetical protein [Halobacillus aidingensis]SDO80595.1 hypothetical protein SAMN05421677_10858 [Halobacillus aidingensis]
MNKETSMKEMKKRFEEIVDSKAEDGDKDLRLAILMTDMEKVFSIPAIAGKRLEAFEKKHSDVLEFYREVSAARKFNEEVI